LALLNFEERQAKEKKIMADLRKLVEPDEAPAAAPPQ
jgi:hypothetical protein